MIEAAHSLKHSNTMCAKTIYFETINLFLNSFGVETLNVTVRFLSSEIWHNHVLKGSRFVLLRFKHIRFCVIFPSRVQSCWHGLTHRIRIKLACVKANSRFTKNSWILDKSFIDYGFTCEDDRKTINHIFSNLLQQVFIGFSKWIEFGTGRFVETNICQVRKCTPSFNMSILFLWQKERIFWIASSVGTTSLLLYQRRKSLKVHIFPRFHISRKYW